ncbi:MAG TPA: YkgJ family cysteine cluster protein [Chitinivibrionales bacterium]|nr:YkgJ family cysteine cluster protein [Chitinivibrionales bacterium]
MTDRSDPLEIPVKAFTIIVETPDGAMPPARVQVPDAPMGLSDLVPPVYELCNGATALAIKKSRRQGRTVTCGPGCGACCRQLVPLSIPETIFLAGYIEGLAPEKRIALKERFDDALDVLRCGGLLDTLRIADGHERGPETALAYFRLGVPCPFLSEESCGIHPVRPCACREYNVTSEPEFCADPLQGKIKRLTVHRKMTTALARAAAGLTGTKEELVPLVMLFTWCERYREVAAMRWKGIGMFEVMMECALGKKTVGR